MTEPASDPSTEPTRRHIPQALKPLEGPVFRGLWLAWLAANMTMWMNDVAAAWVMTTLTDSPVLVALVQTAATLPVFLLGLPSGALADILDRRRYYAGTQLWVSLVAMVLAVCSLTDMLTAPLLLALTFANGIGLAMRWPVFAAIIPQVVSRSDLPAALALNGISMNLSRVVGPMVAGFLISSLSVTAVFVLNALLAVWAFWMILRWRSQAHAAALPGERFIGAMRTGLVFAQQSPRLKASMALVFLFFFQCSALVALLPLVARQLDGGGPGTFTIMLACLGGGAIVAAMNFPRWRARFSSDQFVRWGIVAHAALSALIVLLHEVWMALPLVALAGVAWISTVNVFVVAAQKALPDWVRARGMSVYQMALMGGSALGALVWGQVAGLTSVSTAVLCASAFGLVVRLFILHRFPLNAGNDPDYSPAQVGELPETHVPVSDDAGPVMVTIEYQIDPQRAPDFAEVMQRTRRARLRQGALSWGLFRDTSVPGRYVEYFVDENWLEHHRRLARFSAFDAGLREERLAFHIGSEAPLLRRYVAESLDGSVTPPAL
jgi:MFS family permease/quinol monooxygenase YgiN